MWGCSRDKTAPWIQHTAEQGEVGASYPTDPIEPQGSQEPGPVQQKQEQETQPGLQPTGRASEGPAQPSPSTLCHNEFAIFPGTYFETMQTNHINYCISSASTHVTVSSLYTRVVWCICCKLKVQSIYKTNLKLQLALEKKHSYESQVVTETSKA